MSRIWTRCICGAMQTASPAGHAHPPRLVVNVWNCQAALAVCDGKGLRTLAQQPPREMLIRAVEAAGGAINISGIYPASPALERWARRRNLI